MPLKVIIVGAGIGGLGAAIALCRAGHQVQLLEQSRFANEVGAAIAQPPNALRVMRHWGCDMDAMMGVPCDALQAYNQNVEFLETVLRPAELSESLGEKDTWLMVHRVDMHNMLRATAEKEGATIRLSSRVQSVDTEAGVVTLEDGTTFTGDLIIGADGLHSRCISTVLSQPPRKISTGQAAIRFLIPQPKLQANPVVRAMMDRIGGYTNMFFIKAADRRLAIYPCRHGQVLSVAVIFPETETETSAAEVILQEGAYQASGNMSLLLRVIRDHFGPEVRELCAMAEDIKLWSLASRDPPAAFVKGRLAVLGDAAHPFLPHLGQGAAQALEDGATLGVLFDEKKKKKESAGRKAAIGTDEVEGLLGMYQQLRYERAVTLMMLSRKPLEKREEMVQDLLKVLPDVDQETLPVDLFRYAWAGYPIRDAERLLADTAAAAASSS